MPTGEISLLLAFIAGLLSFLSPCVLPLVPAYIGHLAGTTVTGAQRLPRVRVMTHAGLFVLGFSTIFILFWISIGLAFELLGANLPLIRRVGGVILIVMGLNLLGLFDLPFLYKERRLHLQHPPAPGHATSLLVGMIFAAGWTPCIGPVLGSIIGLASYSETIWQGTWLLVAYCVGLGVPFLLTAAALGGALRTLGRLRSMMPIMSRAGAILIIVIGILMLTDTFAQLAGRFSWAAL